MKNSDTSFTVKIEVCSEMMLSSFEDSFFYFLNYTVTEICFIFLILLDKVNINSI